MRAGTRIGRYDIVERIGAGGMGEVYRARDPQLERSVAIKIVAGWLADDPAAGQRFERERRLTAALDHPHICRLLDAGADDGVAYLVMEYLEGETLSARLSRGAIPQREALGYAIEVAEALAYAHAHRVIHRDLKPANVYLTATGVKVLDFGLAKLRPAMSAAPLPGDTAPLLKTTPGTVIGTAFYMAPERLEGADADERSDVFSFGLVLYEMLTGRPAFRASSMASLIAAVMTSEPPPLALPNGNHQIEWLVRKCLMKAPEKRWQSMSDVAAILKQLAASPVGVPPTRAPWKPLSALAIGMVALVGIGAWSRLARDVPPPAAVIAFRVEPPDGGGFSPTWNSVQSPMLALSPDGTALAYVASGPDRISQIWIRRLDNVEARPLRGTEDAMFPFWSPDGASIGFFSQGALKRIDLAGGPARSLGAAPDPCGGAWSASGDIVFAPSVQGGLKRVPAAGGAVVAATHPDTAQGQTSHRWPRFIGRGPEFLFFARATDNRPAGIYLASLESDQFTFIIKSTSAGDFVPPDRLVLLSEASLVAHPFDPGTRRLTGDSQLLVDGVAASSNHYAAFSVARTGTLAYASIAGEAELTWISRTGQPSSVVARGRLVDFRLSPANQHVAVAETDPRTGHPDLYVVDVKRSTSERLTESGLTDATPVWSPDGSELVFRSNRETVHDLYRRGAFATSPDRPFLKTAAAKYATSWSRDGRSILFHTLNASTGWDIWRISADASTPATPVVGTRFNEAQAQISPDGQWFAYAADEGKAFEVYLQRFTAGGRRWRVSTAGGVDPRWSPTGAELFYVSADRWLMAVPISGDDAKEPGTPQRLFRMPDVPMLPPYTSQYDVASDGTRFLVRVPRTDLRTLPLTVLSNWLLASRAPIPAQPLSQMPND